MNWNVLGKLVILLSETSMIGHQNIRRSPFLLDRFLAEASNHQFRTYVNVDIMIPLLLFDDEKKRLDSVQLLFQQSYIHRKDIALLVITNHFAARLPI